MIESLKYRILWLKRIIFSLISFLILHALIISGFANPIILDQSHHTGISEPYAYDETESSVWEKNDRTDGLSRVLSKDKAGTDCEVLVDVESIAGRASAPTGKFYSVAFETTLSKNLYPGVNASRHFTAANKAMLSTLDDVTMKNLNIVMKTRPNGSIIMNLSPHNWVWHHDVGKGVMQLVPKTQHTPGSIFWNTLHPGGRGGMSIWGGGY